MVLKSGFGDLFCGTMLRAPLWITKLEYLYWHFSSKKNNKKIAFLDLSPKLWRRTGLISGEQNSRPDVVMLVSQRLSFRPPPPPQNSPQNPPQRSFAASERLFPLHRQPSFPAVIRDIVQHVSHADTEEGGMCVCVCLELFTRWVLGLNQCGGCGRRKKTCMSEEEEETDGRLGKHILTLLKRLRHLFKGWAKAYALRSGGFVAIMFFILTELTTLKEV